jgi:hypothetical protein
LVETLRLEVPTHAGAFGYVLGALDCDAISI